MLRSKMSVDDKIEIEWEILQAYRREKPIHPIFIPIKLTGGIGDVIISVDTIKVLAKYYPLSIYTPHIEAFKYFYKDEIALDKYMPNYTWHIDLNTVAEFKMTDQFSGFQNKDIENLFLNQQMMFDLTPQLERLIKNNDEKYYLTSIWAKKCGLDRRSIPAHTLCCSLDLEFYKLDRKEPKKYITMHDGFDAQCGSMVKDRSTKQWPMVFWEDLVCLIKDHYPDYEIIQLGSKTARPIHGVHKCLINQTSITEAFDILSHSTLHIDGDSGLVHAATRMNVPCIVMFGPTPDYFYGYKENSNIRISPCENACFWYTRDWMRDCLIGMTPLCMDSIHPNDVFDLVIERMKNA